MRLGHRPIALRGLPSAEIGATTFAREARVGWDFAVGCRALVSVQLRHAAASPHAPADTGVTLQFRSPTPDNGPGCGSLEPRTIPAVADPIRPLAVGPTS